MKQTQSLAPLYWGVALQDAAAAHVNDMKNLNCFQHNTCSPTLCKLYDGCSFSQRIKYFYGSKPLLAGENVAVGFADSVSVINAYLNSPGHCSNIMYPNFREVGSSRVGNWWGNEFGGGPADTNSPIIMGHHIVALDGSVTFYAVFQRPTAEWPYVDINQGQRQQKMHQIVPQLFSYTLSASDAKKMPKCTPYVIYEMQDRKWFKFPEQGALAMSGVNNCTQSYV